MCKAKKYTEQLLDTYNSINVEFQKLTKELSQVDLYKSDIEHIIEKGGFNAYEGYKLCKLLYDNAQERRKIKNELEPLMQLKNQFIDRNMESLKTTHEAVVRKDSLLNYLSDNKIYTPRVVEKADVKAVTQNNNINKTNAGVVVEMKNRKTGKVITALKKVDSDLFYATYKDKTKNLTNKKDIINFDESKVS